MKRLLAPLLIALAVITAGALERPSLERPSIDLNAIRVDATMNPSKYRALLQRFIDADSTLTVNDMANIYFGYPATYDYNPTRTYPDIQKAFDAEDYITVYDLANQALERDPLSLNLLVKALIAAQNKPGIPDEQAFESLKTRFNKLAQIILLSGRGTMPDSPFIVITQSDMDALLRDVLYITDITERGYFGVYDVVKGRHPGEGLREIVFFFNNPYQAQYEAAIQP